MPLPPLAASERRLARFAAASSWVCALLGLVCACVPQWVLRGLTLGGHAPVPVGGRLFAAAAGAGLIGLAASLRRVPASPREERRAFAPLLWTLGSSALFLALAWKRGDVLGLAARPLGLLALSCAALYLVLAFIYVRAAPGVNLGAPLPAPLEEGPAKPVQLGVRVAPSPEPLAAPPQAAAGASRG